MRDADMLIVVYKPFNKIEWLVFDVQAESHVFGVIGLEELFIFIFFCRFQGFLIFNGYLDGKFWRVF